MHQAMTIFAGLLLATAINAADPPPATATLPLSLFGLSAGKTVTIDGQEQVADAAGLILPLGKPVQVVIGKRPQAAGMQIIAIDASTGAQAPAWALDRPQQNADGTITAVGVATSISLDMVVQRALMNAQKEISRDAAERALEAAKAKARANDTGAGAGAGDRSMTVQIQELTTRTNGRDETNLKTLACVITVAADPALQPAMPTRPGSPGHNTASPIRCWVRVESAAK